MPTGIRSMSVIPSRDVDATARYYIEVLGFREASFFRDGDGPAYFAILDFGEVTLAIQTLTDFSPHEGTVAYIYVDDADALARRIEGAGGRLRHAPHETFYGMLEFDLTDPEGHVIAFGQDLSPGPDGPGR